MGGGFRVFFFKSRSCWVFGCVGLGGLDDKE